MNLLPEVAPSRNPRSEKDSCLFVGLGFRVEGLVFRVEGFGLRV